jgi:hypothetical protein
LIKNPIRVTQINDELLEGKFMVGRIFYIDRHGPISSLQGFLDSLFKLRETIDNVKLWYRGEARTEKPLLPTAGRKQRYFEKESSLTIGQERELLHRFRRRAFPRIGRAITAGEGIRRLSV